MPTVGVNGSKFNDDDRKELVKKFLESDLSARVFCQQNNVHRDSLRTWVKKFRHQIEYNLKDDQTLRGVSKLESWRDENGDYQAQWLKIDIQQQEAADKLRSVADGLMAEIVPADPVDFKGACNSALFSVYIVSDFHLGQYSWIKETGEEWSVETAYKVLTRWIDAAIQQAPDSAQAILCDLGDFLHCDSILPLTPSSGHVLDADGRFFEAVDVAIALFDYAINKLLNKHKSVRVIICEGNHDLTTAHLMSRMIARKYENEPRLSFDLSDKPYYVYDMGNTAVFFHHGHKKKMGVIAESLTAHFREIFGKSKYRYAHVGHLHHREMKESALMVVEQHSTLAAKDAHSARGGYHSERGASVITYHKDFGEVGRITIRPEMLI